MSGASQGGGRLGYLEEIGELKVPGKITWVRSGVNPAVGATLEDVWAPGGIQVKPTAAGVATLVSDSADDTAAGIGARAVRIYGLDATYTYLTEDVILNGLTPVVTTASFFRVSRLDVIDVGTNDFNVGNIDITIGGDIQDRMIPGDNFTHNLNYTVPAKYWLIVTGTTITAESGRDVQQNFYIRNPFVNNGIWRNQTKYIIPPPGVENNPRPFFFVAPFSDISTKLVKLSGSTGQASGLVSGYLTDDPEINSAGNNLAELF